MFRQLILPVRIAMKQCVSGGACQIVGGPQKNLGVSVFTPSASSYHTSSVLLLGRKQRKETGSTFEKKKAVADGEGSVIVEKQRPSEENRFPDFNLPTREFNGIMFKDLPIVNIKASMNNTIMNVTDSNGVAKMIRSCGYDGFKNARKGTNVAAQATGFTFGKKLVQRGFRTVRARVKGLGPGRLASLRGLTFAGINVVSITDFTVVPDNPLRSRKQRRL